MTNNVQYSKETKNLWQSSDRPNKTFKDPVFPFRKGTVHKASQKHIDRVKGKSISSFGSLPVYFLVAAAPHSSFPMFSWLIGQTLFKFVVPQFLQKSHLAHYPVKHVDHYLDEKVPFRPELIHVYMDFVNIWVRPMRMLMKRFGFLDGSKLCAEFFRYLKITYNAAWDMYKRSLTTTYRPACNDSKIRRLRRADPHYMCVPSLHIALVCLCFSFYRMIFEREGFTEEEKTMWNAELYDRATEIGETVLYLKQHSVNCIPAALYMITRIAPELFTVDDAINFINSLFKNAPDVEEKDKKEINAHIQFLYERLVLEGTQEENWFTPVLRWLEDYKPYRPFYAE